MDAPVGSRLTSAVETRRVLGMRVDATSYEHAATEILGWASSGESRYVCIATVNNVIEAHDNPAYQRVMEARRALDAKDKAIRKQSALV